MTTFDLLHVFAGVGLLGLLAFLVPSPLLALYQLFARPGKTLKRYGEYALITGATDGIGRAMALELAKQGVNLVLVSRTQDKLNETEAEIKTIKPNLKIQTVAIDFANFSAEHEARLSALFQSLDIGILVNNVGQSYANPQYFHEISAETVKSLIALNISSTTVMTHLALPSMVRKKRGCVVNMSSFSSLVPAPLLAEYGAAKAYINHFTEALAVEYKSYGIHFQAQCPAYVTSKLSKIRHASFLTPSPKTYAKAAVKAFGYETISLPYWPHALQNRIIALIPKFVLSNYILSLHKGIRAKALKKSGSKTQ